LSGKLYIVSTPIGNLDDISKRALGILGKVDLIATEDTRVTGKLLHHYKIKNKLFCYNDFNENTKYEYLLQIINNDNDVALVSDAGTPCISDPGYRIVNAAVKSGYNVVAIPGSCSIIAALSISGLPTDKFYFEGFLPKKKGRQKRLDYLKNIDGTIVLFESPKRIFKTLNDIKNILGNRVVSICKEITKIHERVTLDFIENIFEKLDVNIKGEHVILVAKDGYKLSE